MAGDPVEKSDPNDLVTRPPDSTSGFVRNASSGEINSKLNQNIGVGKGILTSNESNQGQESRMH
jgi:hypothetical protein